VFIARLKQGQLIRRQMRGARSALKFIEGCIIWLLLRSHDVICTKYITISCSLVRYPGGIVRLQAVHEIDKCGYMTQFSYANLDTTCNPFKKLAIILIPSLSFLRLWRMQDAIVIPDFILGVLSRRIGVWGRNLGWCQDHSRGTR